MMVLTGAYFICVYHIAAFIPQRRLTTNLTCLSVNKYIRLASLFKCNIKMKMSYQEVCCDYILQ